MMPCVCSLTDHRRRQNVEITKKWYIFTSALKLFSSVMHGNDSVILCERYEARDLTLNLSGFHSERLEKANFVPDLQESISYV